MQAIARNSSSIVIYFVLGAVILAGLGLRTWNVRFDGGLNSHPDERSTTCFYAPTIGWPSDVDEFLDPQRSPLNPLWDRHNERRRSFTYGHFPLYLGILTGELLSGLSKPAGLLPLSDRSIELMERADTACEGGGYRGPVDDGFVGHFDDLSALPVGEKALRRVGRFAGSDFFTRSQRKPFSSAISLRWTLQARRLWCWLCTEVC